ncbi:MAG: glycosyltransferase family 2 protein [Elusimicrobia bacterium]|nr:glycosyltransferase family 2 protein [Elusimicrobiota bacterium]
MPEPLFSVVIDNYNYGRFLGEAIESVLAQEFPSGETELIIVDDGSTDDSRRVIESFGDRVAGVYQDNQGQATAFNNGIRRAQGRIVCLLDSDDFWRKDKLKKVAERFQRQPELGAVQHYLQDVDLSRRSLDNPLPPWPESYGVEDFLDGRVPYTATSGLAYRRELLLQALPIPKKLFYYLDDYLSTRALFSAPLGNIREALGYHRVHGQNFCAQGLASPEKIEKDFFNRDIFRKELEGWLSRFGKDLSPKYLAIEALEILRRRILLEAYRGNRREAARAWLKGLRLHWRGPFGKFRLLTCALAVLSPRLYVGLYDFYGRRRGLVTLRAHLFPER